MRVVRQHDLDTLAGQLAAVPGVVAVTLGGSRARGTHRQDSDVDLGLYYLRPLDTAALRTIAAEVADDVLSVTEPGGWGPWVDGGAWLSVGGMRVDWIYRDLDRVQAVWAQCQAGTYTVATQPGHPLGFYSHAYAGEVALSRPLADPTGELAALREATRRYPGPLADALVAGLWEADFCVGLAGYGAKPGHCDPTYTAGCLFRAVGVLVHALHGAAHQWLINEKGMVAATQRLPSRPADFASRAHHLLSRTGAGPDEIAGTVADASRLVADTRSVLGRRPRPVP